MASVVTKQTLGALALFGGEPAFSEAKHVGRPNIGDRARFMSRMNEMLDRNWLTNNGPFVQELEQRIAKYLGARNCIAMCNATVALEIAARALGMAGEVIVPSFTFVATGHALQWQQITPVFCDVDPDSHNIDPRRIEALITPRTTGILGVHAWGRTCDVNAIDEIAKEHGLRVLYDAAHAFGCACDGVMIGNFGDAEVFSFHATKFFNSFEGGAVVTNDDALAGRIRLMTNFGFAGTDRVVYLGINGKMSEPCAAMALRSLESLDHFVGVNRRNYEAYRATLACVPGVRMVEYDARHVHNYQYVVLEVNPDEAGITRDELVLVLTRERILARRYFYPGCHRMEPYRSYYPHAGLLLPQTERLTNLVVSLPTGTAVDEQDIAGICSVIRLAVENAPRVREALARPPESAPTA